MSVLGFLRPSIINEVPENVETSTLGSMPMTLSVKLSLMALRGYLILMTLLVLYHVLDLAGVPVQQGH
jgi:hypothetical protein